MSADQAGKREATLQIDAVAGQQAPERRPPQRLGHVNYLEDPPVRFLDGRANTLDRNAFTLAKFPAARLLNIKNPLLAQLFNFDHGACCLDDSTKHRF